MAPIMALMQRENIQYNYISTGQHKESIDDICKNFSIKKPDYTLYSENDITKTNQMFSWLIKTLWYGFKNRKKIFNNDKNGIVLVHGDTLSTLLGALLGKLARLKVGHVESGLRSFNLFHPFPEEITRLLVFRLSNYFFAPNSDSVKNLEKYKGFIIKTEANTLYDALEIFKKFEHSIQIDLPDFPYVIITLHRFENIFNKESLQRIVSIVEHISKNHKVLFILHKPTKEKLQKFDLYTRLENNKNIEMRPRYDYFNFIKLLKKSLFVVSDGGSNQEECYYLGKPILLLRNATERPDGLNENCLLSYYSIEKIKFFLENYSIMNKAQKNFEVSPSRKILDECRMFI
jgi:UDP-N-acetylglucosamine 2-epimerase (non-hydrolysing)